MDNRDERPAWLAGVKGEFLPRLIESRANLIRVTAGLTVKCDG